MSVKAKQRLRCYFCRVKFLKMISKSQAAADRPFLRRSLKVCRTLKFYPIDLSRFTILHWFNKYCDTKLVDLVAVWNQFYINLLLH